MRNDFFVTGLCAVACAGPQSQGPFETGDVAVVITRANLERQPALAVTITNRSPNDLCVRAELLQNPYTYEMDLNLRKADGRVVKRHQPGFLPPPNMTPVRIEPGRSVRGQYYVDARFKLKGKGRQFLQGMSAEASFRYDSCDASQSREAASGWQRI
jgi:hypothetical protein